MLEGLSLLSHTKFAPCQTFNVTHTRDATIWVIAILRIAFECIAIYWHIAIYEKKNTSCLQNLFLAVKAK